MILEAVVAPIFSALAGEARVPTATVSAVAGARFSARPDWTWYVPVELSAAGAGFAAAPIQLQSAHTTLLARAHGYLPVGPDRAVVEAGETVLVRRFLAGGRPLP
jgi:molybdopterin biosynthesis enzyme